MVPAWTETCRSKCYNFKLLMFLWLFNSVHQLKKKCFWYYRCTVQTWRLSSERLKMSLYSMIFFKKMARCVKPSRRLILLFIWNIFRCDVERNRPKKKMYFSMQNYTRVFIVTLALQIWIFAFSKWILGWNPNPKWQEFAHILHLKEHHTLESSCLYRASTVLTHSLPVI